ncbi:hypothetical protein RGQ29_012207 [Quercus rubra]|uniref:Uncharacterized protein n=2 Tax=Quercus rubra TaxID=3512 RepID=A0AAN7JA03_QUERU|nr:hypothetical protein RGQ29_012207 [Quercus rubra]KAK4603596.1 hypothetical protein RGQ29_012207 [Quercus rubra]
MAHTIKFLHPIRQSLTAITSSSPPISHSRKFFYAKFEPLKMSTKGLEPVLRNYASTFHSKLYTQRKYFCFSGSKLSIGSIFGVSIVLGSKSFWPRIAYAMDGHDILLDDRHFLDDSDAEEDPQPFWMHARKFWLPVFFFLTVLTNLDHPIVLITFKVILFLLSTKPSPLSVYVFVDQLCQQSMRQEPHLYKVKSLYAKKVEVQDYKLLCLAKVELKEETISLIGILGGWWTLPTIFYQGTFSFIRNGALKYYSENN